MAFYNSKPPSQRQLKVGENLRHALSDIFFSGEFFDPRLDGISITVSEVQISPDLRNAHVYVTTLGGSTPEAFLDILGEHAVKIRRDLSRKVYLKYMPNLLFRLDSRFERAERIESLFATNSDERLDAHLDGEMELEQQS